ncbi:hypothetical protein K488DRAFT_81953 [Vararia minispora EC-137]|uniref:Uncharacterized protein n=1 Tax=Vararia minispora EC-137 TaxID=1314806 RepID=A0ACB8QXD9_9AGAM|nr:hypothetical protein K488DRAFT_81953 [Vararia minispora EC-137]
MSGVSAPSPVNGMDSAAPSDRPSSPSALREAALMSMRSAKRRRPALETMLAPTPMVTSRSVASRQHTIQLDYGQDDSVEPAQPANTASSSSSVVNVGSIPLSASQPPHMASAPIIKTEDKDVDMREEGEISDEEESPAPPAPPPVPASDKPIRQSSLALPLRPTPAVTIPAPASALPVQSRTPPTSNGTPTSTLPPRSLAARIDMDEDVSVTAPPTPSSSSSTASENTRFPFPLDANHVRPGLALTQEQYDTAKDIVLDLLGWGVPPEYLVDCGLSREIVYYIFSELNLRLPNNLDKDGIIPYPPSSELLQHSPNEPIVESPAESEQHRVELPSLFSRISDSGKANLADMEQQRRQELLARKAVLASRKRKVTSVGDGPVNKKAAMAVVAQDSVDDFLSSIGTPVPAPTSAPSSRKGKEVTRDVSLTEEPRSASPEQMEVDDIPGLGDSTHATGPTPLSATSSLSSATGHVSSSSSDSTPVPPVAPATRRKRPVASDFVDEDASASAPATPGLGRSPSMANAQPHPNPHVRRWMASEHRPAPRTVFSTLTAPQCVIDWNSDSDDDVEDVEDDFTGGDGMAGMSLMPSSAGVGGMTPPVTTPSSASELEKRIAEMREEIRAKEELRLRKLAATFTGVFWLGTVHAGWSTGLELGLDSGQVRIGDNSAGTNTVSLDGGSRAYGYSSRRRRHGVGPGSGRGPSRVFEHADRRRSFAYAAVASFLQDPVEQPSPLPSAGTEIADFRPYSSVLAPYPFLGGLRSLAGAPPDLLPLKVYATVKHKRQEASLEDEDDVDRVCMYEVGGGECRDPTCSSFHLSRLAPEASGAPFSSPALRGPSVVVLSRAHNASIPCSALSPVPPHCLADEDTAQFLGDARALGLLRAARKAGPNLTLEERVGAAWASLGANRT